MFDILLVYEVIQTLYHMKTEAPDLGHSYFVREE